MQAMDISNESRPDYYGWRVVAASLIALTFGPSTIAVMNFGLFIPPIEAEFSWSRTQVALATTIISYMIVVISPLQGYLVDYFGTRRVILCSIPAFALGVGALYVLPSSLWVFYAAWVVIPLLGIGLFPLAYLKVVGTWFRHRLGLALGIANAGIGLGAFVIPVIAGSIIVAVGWRHAYAALAAIILFVTFPVAWLFISEHAPTGTAAETKPVRDGMALGAAARTPAFRLLATAFFLLGLINTALIVNQVPMLVDAGVTPARAVAVQSVFGLFSLLGRLLTGLLLDLLRAPVVMILFALGAALACATYAAGASGEIVFLCAALIGLAFGAEFDVLAYMIKSHFGLMAFGKIYGVIFAVFQFGAGIGAAGLPMSRDAFDSYGPGLWVFAGITLLCAAAFSRIGEPTQNIRLRYVSDQ
jgi:MFS family permease